MSRISILIAAVAMVVAACATADATDSSQAPSTTATITTTTIGGTSDEIVGLVLTGTDAGNALATSDGRTVYLLTRDDPDTTTCFDGCLVTWPPVPATADLGYGLDARLVGTIDRPDGTIQATYAGWPLYFYSGDEPGEATGQGFGGVWFLVGADGTPVGEARRGYGY